MASIRELATLLGVGIPLLEALATLARQHSGGMKVSLMVVHDRIAAGTSLADAMRQQPRLFDELCVSMVEVGESAGTLDTVLERLAEFKERWQRLKGRILTALLYPAIVLSMGLLVSVFLMTFVVPNLLQTLLEADKELPGVTRMVKALSDLLLADGWLMLGLIIAAGIGIRLLLRRPAWRLAWHRWQLHLPLLGPLVQKQEIVRIATVISTLLGSGLVFVRALQIAQRTTRNLVLRDALRRCEAAVGAGSDIAAALEATEAFPPAVIQIFAMGQQSGRLESMLDRLAASYDQQVQTAAARLTAALEPALILLLAIFVGIIAFATMLPILEAGNVL